VTGQVEGPLLLDGHAPGAGPVGMAFGRGYCVGTALAAGLRAVGPPLRVTRAERHMLYELDGLPALQQLLDVSRDGMPAADRSRLAEGLHLEVAAAGSPPSAGPPLAVLGADRTNGAMAVAGDLERGMVVRFASPDPSAVAAALHSSLVGSAAAVLLAAPGHGHRLVDPMTVDDAWDPATERPLPMATLTCTTALQHRRTPVRSEPRSETTVAAYFT
jgi:small ligand-binding sensory domain FIST